MSKHKHLHNIKSPLQAIQHGRKNGFGPMRSKFARSSNSQTFGNLEKEAAASAPNTDDGKETQHDA